MGPAPKWPITALRVVAPVVMLLLVVQYLLGLWTNLYAPAAGFTSNTSFPALDWHYNIGYTLGILGIASVVLAALSHETRMIGTAVVMFVGILAAGFAGGAFVGSSPNPPNDSLAMGALFLVAFGGGIGLAFNARVRWEPRPAPSATASA